MNTHEKKYARTRIECLRDDLIIAAKKKHSKPAVVLSPKERAKAFKAWQFKVLAGVTEIGIYTQIKDVLKFDGEGPSVFAEKKYNAAVGHIQKEATRVIDEIMLGDSQEALRLIEQFSKFKA